MAKLHIHEYEGTKHGYFFCPGCQNTHGIIASGPHAWMWNGDVEAPTISPSILCNKDDPGSRCHSYVENGHIRFLHDCWHDLKDQTVPLEDYEV